MKKLITACLLIAIMSTAVSIFGQIQVYKLADKKVEVAGTIRCIDETGWFVMNDQNHTPINISKIEMLGTNILIYYTFSASTIHSFIVTPDETLAASGFFLGAAATRDYAVITLSKVNDQGIVESVDPSQIRSELVNIWIHGLFSVD